MDIWEWEREWLSPFPNFGNGNGNDKLHSHLLGTGMKILCPIFGNGACIPGNGREREFPLTPDCEWKRQKYPCLMAVLPPGKFLHVAMKSTIKKIAKMHRFLDGLKTFRMIWKLSGWSENFLNGLETFRMVWKLSGRSGNFPDGLETFRMIWKLFVWSGNFPDGFTTQNSYVWDIYV